MPRAFSTDKDASKNPARSKKQEFYLSSPKTRAVVARLQYVGEYLFGGNLKVFAAATGFGYDWLRNILDEHSRVRVSTLIRFAESGIVAPEWLLCGTGPMFKDAARADSHALPVVTQNQNSLFDTGAIAPIRPVKFKLASVNKRVPAKLLTEISPLAQAIYSVRSADGPVIVYLDENAIKAGVGLLVLAALKAKFVTHIVMPTAAALTDVMAAQTVPDAATVLYAIQLAANNGLGLAEGLSRWAFSPVDDRARSVLAASHAANFYPSVLADFGDSQLYANPGIAGAQIGAAIGATSYVDFLAFVKTVQSAANNCGLFINMGGLDGFAKLKTAVAACNRAPNKPDFSHFHTAHLAPIPVNHKTTYAFLGNHSVLLAAVLQSCTTVYEGNPHDKNGKRKNSVAG
jgi:hypothetical protein